MALLSFNCYQPMFCFGNQIWNINTSPLHNRGGRKNTYSGMDELLNPAGGEPAEKPGTLAVLWHTLKGANLFFPVEEDINTFTVQSDQNFPERIAVFGWPIYLENLISHRTLQWNHLQRIHIIGHIAQIGSHRSQHFHYFFRRRATFQQFHRLNGHSCTKYSKKLFMEKVKLKPEFGKLKIRVGRK